MQMPDEATRFEPATLTVGALIVVAPQTEVMLSRTAEGRWTITVRSTRSATPPSARSSPRSRRLPSGSKIATSPARQGSQSHGGSAAACQASRPPPLMCLSPISGQKPTVLNPSIGFPSPAFLMTQAGARSGAGSAGRACRGGAQAGRGIVVRGSACDAAICSGQDSAAWPPWRSTQPAYPAGRQAWTASAVFW